MQKAITELKKRLERLKNEENVLVVYHFDVDGCAAASILWRIFQQQNVISDFFPATRGFEQIVADKIKRKNPSKVILVDYVPGPEISGFLENYNTEVLDHHTHEEFLEKFDYFTSVDYGTSMSISYLLSVAAEELGIPNVKWLGHIGAYWDKTLEKTEFFKENIYSDEINNMMPFNLVVSLTQTKGSEKLFQILNESASLDEALERVKSNEDYVRAKELFDEELRDIKFSRKYLSDIKLSMYWVRTRFKHIRIYVDYITYTTAGTHIFILDETSRFKLSFRTSLNINLVDIIRELASEDKNFSGGGHPQACGAMLKNENIEELLNKFIEKYRKLI